MTDRKNIKVDEETRERLQELKRNGETWDGLLLRGADAIESESNATQDAMREAIRDELQRFKDELLSDLRR